MEKQLEMLRAGTDLGIALAGHLILGYFVGAGIVFGKVLVKLIQNKLDYDDLERGLNSEISWVYEIKKRFSK